MSRIELNVVATGNFRNLETSLSRLRTQVNSLNASLVGGRGGDQMLTQVQGYVKGFENAIDASGMFERHMVSITSETNKFGRALQSGQLRIGGLFRAAVEYRRTELGQIRQLAREQVRLSNSTVMRMPDGRAQVIVPRGIDEAIDKQRILNQEYRIFRQVVQNGSTEIINWGKNTQWAGRQLTVGLTVPLTIFGATAGKMFMDADKQLVRLAKVYGDATKGMVDAAELDKIRSQTLSLSQELASGLGIAASETMGIAADIAATGREGNELLASTREAIRLSVLGEVDRQEAMRATLSIQSVFKKDTDGLAESINFLNAVENQTSTSLNDLVEGIVKAGPVVQGLGGDMEDLALMMVAMREGGIPAAEAANAIKSSLASLINPTKQTRDLMNGFGVDLVGIVEKNAGNVTGTLVDLQEELSKLNDLSRQRAIEQIFGKFQFSRINAMLSNIGRAGSQTEQVLAIAGMSTAELAETAERELTAMTESISGKFGRAVETLKANLIPVGEAFVQVGTFLLNVGNKVLEVFNMIPEPLQNVVKGLMFLTALAGPVIMITGVLGNFFGYLVKGISSFMAFKKAGRGMFELFTPESVAATSATETLTESLFDQKVAMGDMAVAVETLVQKLETLVTQLHEVGGAASNFDKVGAKAEAAAMSASADPTIYTTPGINWRKEPGRHRFTGPKEAGVDYSHLTAESAIGSGLMGLGTFVSPSATEIQRSLQAFSPDITSISESSVTPELRRTELMRIAEIQHGSNAQQLAEVQAKIRALTDEELSQLLPTWEKITAQSSEYFAIMSVAAEKAEAGNAEVEAAFKKFSTDIDSGRDFESSLAELRSAINGSEGAVDARVEQIKQEFESIRQEVSSIEDPGIRARATVSRVSQSIIDPYEKDALKVLQEQKIPGVGKDGITRPLMYAIQEYTDDLFNSGKVTREYSEALRQSLIAHDKQKQAAEELAQSQKDLEAANDRAQQALSSAYPGKQKDLSTAEKRDGRWYVEDKVVGQKQKELIAALDEREAQLKRNVAAGEQLINAENEYGQSLDILESQRELDRQQSAELEGATEEVIIATKELAASRREAAGSDELVASTRSAMKAAEAQLLQTKKEHARAQQEATRALFRYGAGSPQYKEASAKELTLRKRKNAQEAEVLSLSEQLKKSIAESTQIKRRVTKEEAELIAIRERQSQEIIRNTGSTARNTGATDRGTVVKDIQTGANVKDAAATNRNRGLGTAGRLGGALSALSMISMFIPRGEDPNSGLSQTADVLGGVGMGAGMGAMIGSVFPVIGTGIGAAVGGVIGGIAPVMGILSNNAENAAKELERLKLAAEVANGKILDLERSTFDLKPIRELADLPLDGFKLETENATNQLYQFTEALKMAEEGTAEYEKVQQFKGFGSAEELISSSLFQQMMMSLVQSGASEQTVKGILAGYLSASGKQDFTQFVNSEIEKIFDLGTNPQEIGVNYANELKRIADEALEKTDLSESQIESLREADASYESARVGEDGVPVAIQIDGQDIDVVDLAQRAQQFAIENGMSPENLDEQFEFGPIEFARTLGLDVDGLGHETVREIMRIAQGLSGSIPELSRYEEELNAISQAGDAMANSLQQAFVSADPSSLKEWVNSVDPETLDESSSALSEFLNQLRMTGDGGKDAATALEQMIAAGTDVSDALLITRMIISDVNTDWQQLASMARTNPAEFDIVWTHYVQGSPPGNVTAAGATMPEDVGGRLSGTIDWSGGGSSGGGGADTSAIDEQIEAQDKLIEKIKEEREERQKLLNLEKEAFDFAMQEQDLKNQIAQARAEGRMADAALLQSRLDAEREFNKKEESERRRQEQEDRRIKKAEEEKERLQEQKQGSSGGGGGGGSSGPSKQQQEWTANRINILTSGVISWTEGAQLRAMTLEKGPWSAFFESDKVKKYREELAKLGVPAVEIDGILNEMFESWINNNSELFEQTEEYGFIRDQLGELKLGAEGVKEILPEAFSILLDKNLSESEKINLLTGQIYDLGFEQDEARRKAEKLYNFYNENEFDSPGIDDEIQRWIEFNDIITKLNDDLDKLNSKLSETDEQGNLVLQGAERGQAAAAARYTGAAAAVLDGTYGGGQLNAGGVTINTADIEAEAANAGAATTTGYNSGIDQNLNYVDAAGRRIATTSIEATKDELESTSPSKVYERVGIDVLKGFANGISKGSNSSEISDSFSEMIENTRELIINGFEETPSDITPSIQSAADTFYSIMTTRIQETADKISNILQTSLPGHSFDIVGTPKIYIAAGTDSIWSSILGTTFNSLPITRTLPAFREGGKVTGPGGPTDDKILAQLSDGEYVIRAASVNKYGVDFLDRLNAQKYAVGGYVSADRAAHQAQNRNVSNNVANQIGGYAGQAMRQPYYGYSKPTPTSTPRTTGTGIINYNTIQSVDFNNPAGPSFMDAPSVLPGSGFIQSMLSAMRDEVVGFFSNFTSPVGSYELYNNNENVGYVLPGAATGRTPEEYAEYVNSGQRGMDTAFFLSNLIPLPGIQGVKTAFSTTRTSLKGLRTAKPRKVTPEKPEFDLENITLDEIASAQDYIKGAINEASKRGGPSYRQLQIRNIVSSVKSNLSPTVGRILANAMLGLDRGVGGLGRNVDSLTDVGRRSSVGTTFSAEDMARMDIQSQVTAMRETFRARKTLPQKPRPIDDMTLARSISEYTSQKDWDDLAAFANANDMNWDSIIANMSTDPEAFQRASFIKQKFLEERMQQVALAQQSDPTYLRLLADNDRAAKEFRDSFNSKWQELYGNEDPLFLPEPTAADAGSSQAGVQLGHRYQNVQRSDVFLNDPDAWTQNIPSEIRNGRIARVLSEVVGGDMGRLAPIFEKSTTRAVDRQSTQIYGGSPQIFGSKAELLQSSYPERIFEYYYGADPFSVLKELSYRDSMGYLDGMTATGASASTRHAAAMIDPLYQELGERSSLVAARTLYPEINWTVDTPIQISKVWSGAMPVKDGDFGSILNLSRADRIALNEGAHLMGSGIGTARMNPGFNISSYQEPLRRGYTIPGKEKSRGTGDYSTSTPITFPGNVSDSHTADPLLAEILDRSYSMSDPFGPTGLAIHYTPGMGHTYSSLNPHVSGFWTYNPQASSMGMFADPSLGLGGATADRLGIGQDALNSAQGSIRLGDTFGTFGLGAEQQVLVPPARVNNLSSLKGMSKSLNTKAIMENRGTVLNPVILDTAYTKSGSRRFKYTSTIQSMGQDEYNSFIKMLDEYDKYGDQTGGPRFTKDQLLEAVIINEADGRYTISANPHYMNYLGKDFLDRVSVIDEVQSYLIPRGGSKALDEEDISELTDAFWRSRLERLKAESGLSFDPKDTSPKAMAEVVSQEEVAIYNRALENPLSLGNYSNESVRDAIGIVEGMIGKQLYVDTNISSKYRLWKAGSYTPKDIDEVRSFQMIDAIENPEIPRWPGVGRFAEGGLVRLNKSQKSILGEEMSSYAKQFVGTPYSPNSFNSRTGPDTGDEGWGCATAMEWLFNNKANMSLGNKSLSWGQYQSAPGKYVSEGANLPGDLLYFYYPNGVNTQNPINHTGMYVGGGSMFHAQNPAQGTNVTGIDEDNLFSKGPYAKRVLPETIAGMGIPTGRFKDGGSIYGQGGPKADNLLAWLSNGEYVISADTVKHYGKDFMDALNGMHLAEFATGGLVSRYPSVVAKMGGGSTIAAAKPGMLANYGKNTESNIEYNISVQVLGSNASPEDIAREVQKAMRQRENMRGSDTRI